TFWTPPSPLRERCSTSPTQSCRLRPLRPPRLACQSHGNPMFPFPQGMPLAMRISSWTLIFGAVSLTVAQTVAAQPPALTAPEVLAERFPNCVQQLQSQALSGGVSQNTVEQV